MRDSEVTLALERKNHVVRAQAPARLTNIRIRAGTIAMKSHFVRVSASDRDLADVYAYFSMPSWIHPRQSSPPPLPNSSRNSYPYPTPLASAYCGSDLLTPGSRAGSSCRSRTAWRQRAHLHHSPSLRQTTDSTWLFRSPMKAVNRIPRIACETAVREHSYVLIQIDNEDNVSNYFTPFIPALHWTYNLLDQPEPSTHAVLCSIL